MIVSSNRQRSRTVTRPSIVVSLGLKLLQARLGQLNCVSSNCRWGSYLVAVSVGNFNIPGIKALPTWQSKR